MAFILEEPSADLLSILTYAYCLTIQMIENYLYWKKKKHTVSKYQNEQNGWFGKATRDRVAYKMKYRYTRGTGRCFTPSSRCDVPYL